MVEKPFQNISNFDKIFSALSSQMNKTKGGDHTIISRKEKNTKKKKKIFASQDDLPKLIKELPHWQRTLRNIKKCQFTFCVQ